METIVGKSSAECELHSTNKSFAKLAKARLEGRGGCDATRPHCGFLVDCSFFRESNRPRACRSVIWRAVGQITSFYQNCVKPCRPKYFSSVFRKNMIVSAHPVPARGAFRDRHERWARDAMDAATRNDEACRCGRPSRVVLA